MRHILPICIAFVFFLVLFSGSSTAENRKASSYLLKKHTESTQRDSSITGRVLDPITKNPLPGVSVAIKGSRRSTYTDQNGSFQFDRINRRVVLVFSHVGYARTEIRGTQNMGTILLKQDEHSIEEVVISTGMFTRKASSFTGAAVTIKGEELRQVGNINLIESLRSLDPSFILLDNNALGSDPNQTYQIQVRGQTSLSSPGGVENLFANDPNQPLFVLDGMETTLRQIMNLDITRVASVTILKDAASTALYGSRAANGVVVVETIRPTPGELRVAYNAIGVLEVPDLRSYNMMNSAEFLEFQLLAGHYVNAFSSTSPIANQLVYNSRLQEVARGVDSYWLDVPLQPTFNVRHSLNVSGGDESFVYNVGGGYRNDEGVMIGSNNRIADGNITMSYRKGKINITNIANINGTIRNNSPYGNFSTYVNLPPFYRREDEFGNLNTNRYLEEYRVLTAQWGTDRWESFEVANPLYNAMLNNRNRNTSLYLNNNLNVLWDVLPSLRVNAGFQATQVNGTNERFISAANTMFDNTDILERGSYTVTQTQSNSYQGFLGLIYNKVFNEKHSINGNLRGNIQETRNAFLTTEMIGFPVGVEPVPNFSTSYAPNSSARGFEQVDRDVSLISSINYSYKGKYSFDATFNMDGANSFGTDNLYTPFWALGVGWNLEREEIFNLPRWINVLRFRGNYGITGNQNFGQFTSGSTYIYHADIGSFGQGMVLSTLGNPTLDWQNTAPLSLGMDAVLFDKRLTVTLNAYQNITDPLIAAIALPTSTGVSSYLANVGGLRSKGWEYNIQGQIIRNENTTFTLGVFDSVLDNEYFGLGNRLEEFNETNRESNSLRRYLDGYSPDDIWAVQSAGIDPTSGEEIFLKLDGTYTSQWDINDEILVGNSRPFAEGVINANLFYKNFRFSAYIRYQYQQSTFNSSLFSRVENITNLSVNQDRRALTERWIVPGDISRFRDIANREPAQMSDRFIQDESALSGESISLGYDFNKKTSPWLGKLRLSSLRSSVTANQVFRLSNIQAERGTSYPFSRTVTFTLNAFF